MPADSSIRDHKAWLGYIQPEGLVVSPAALVDAQVLLDRNTLPLQERFLPFVKDVERDGDDPLTVVADFATFAREFLDWPDDSLYGLSDDRPLPETLTIPLPEFGETLAPSFAFREPRPKDPENPWLLLVKELPLGTDLDENQGGDERGWNVSPGRRFERLLRETRVPIGLLSNGSRVRLYYAPRGENSGSATFMVKEMTEVAGRPILAAFHMLLDRYRLLAAPSEARLPALLARSRDYQSRVSTTLAQQVLDALYELLRGFQGADERAGGELLRSVIERRPDDVYGGLLTVLMRLVFLLFAEDRGLMPTSELYVRHYSIHGLFERLRTDNEQYPDTMDHRFGAWPQLLTLFRTVYQGCRHPQMSMPARFGHLFDPERYPFLEGRTTAEPRLPLVSDGTVYRVLEKLFILDGERLSYRTLDVEEIGSVYQTVMGFRLEVVTAPSIAIAGKRKHKGEVAAPTVINLSELLAKKAGERAKWLKEHTDQEVTGEAERALKFAANLDDLLAALDRKIARNATPHVVPRGAAVLQPTDERRRSGSHYTPRSFTEPIVRTTLRPVLERLGEHPTAEQILDLKVCDLAVGSAAFLVETCRQLGDALVKAWQHHGDRPALPPDETEELLARRLVAQRCLYGVDRNPMAVDLSKLSLWLATLAKDHPFTFLDHSIRHGDSLVGLTRRQIADFHWLPENKRAFGQETIESRIRSASNYRKQILDAGDFITPQAKHEKLAKADEALDLVREAGDLVIAAFFSTDRERARRQKRDELLARFTESLRDVTVSLDEETGALRRGRFAVTPFHYEIEFPEVFDREDPGFDAIVGNPPFLAGSDIWPTLGGPYRDYLRTAREATGGKAVDLVTHFFRQAASLTNRHSTVGLIATNTVSQGDTRAAGLGYICTHGWNIYAARKRILWPGVAAVVVSNVHFSRGLIHSERILDGKVVSAINSLLLPTDIEANPKQLRSNQGFSFRGHVVLGMGFTFDDEDASATASSLTLMKDLIEKDEKNAECIFPYIGGAEINTSPTLQPHRFVICFGNLSYEEAEKWPDLMAIVRQKVLPERSKIGGYSVAETRSKKWWQFGTYASALQAAIKEIPQCLVLSRVSTNHALVFQPTTRVFSDAVVVFPFYTYSAFGYLQSRAHEIWARLLGSTMKDDLRYTSSDCCDTFPFVEGWHSDEKVERVAREYYEFRANLMLRNNEGLTKTYNRFHDPDERQPDILRLRELHDAIDRAVLDAYGWNDIQPTCEFLLDYEDEEDDNAAPRRRKKPWRYRWPDEIRDEVLARLLALNAQRAKEEQLAGQASAPAPKAKTGARKGRKKKANSDGQGVIEF